MIRIKEIQVDARKRKARRKEHPQGCYKTIRAVEKRASQFCLHMIRQEHY